MRGLALLLGGCGAASAGLLWWMLDRAGVAAPDATNLAARLALALVALLPSVGLLWAMLLAQTAARLARGAGRFARRNRRVIGDTAEHLLVFGPALLALAAGVDRPQMPGVIALAAVFAAARAATWAGALVAAVGGAFGTGATLAATAGALGGAVAVWGFGARLG